MQPMSSRDRYSPPDYISKGVTMSLPIVAPESWEAASNALPNLPQDSGTLELLIDRVRSKPACGGGARAMAHLALGNPNLTDDERAALVEDLDGSMPSFEKQLQTDHFVFHWTKQSTNQRDNVSNDAIIDATAEELEKAHSWCVDTFGRAPYVPFGANRIEVVFRDLDSYGRAEPPDYPIQFDAETWRDLPGTRRPTGVHELFHKLQYAFGYRTRWLPVADMEWFSEGSASLAEVLYGKQVSKREKVTDLFARPFKSLWQSSYSALPFWIFFTHELAGGATALTTLLANYEQSGDPRQALAKSIDRPSVPADERTMPGFFIKFVKSRLDAAFWGAQGINDQDAQLIAPTLVASNHQAGDGFALDDMRSVQELGCNYYRVSYDAAHDRQSKYRVDVLAGEVNVLLMTLNGGTVTTAEMLSPNAEHTRAATAGVTNVLAIVGLQASSTYSLRVKC
jgi:hypothetical protein